jgi:probable HAF family extracellular repeat protein
VKAVLAATLTAASVAVGSAPWRIVDVGTPAAATSSESTGVGADAAGDIVANSSAVTTGRAFVFHAGRRTLLPALVARGKYIDTYASAVNHAGEIVGSATAERGETHATKWQNGKAVDLGVLPGGHLSEADAIAPDGDAAGRSTTGHGQHVVLWLDGRHVDLGPPPPLPHADDPDAIVNALNNTDEIVGVSETEFFGRVTAQRAFRSVGRRLVPLTPLGTQSDAVAVNASGEIAGSYTLPDGSTHACLWRDGQLIDLGTLPDTTSSRAVAIDDGGEVAGTSWDHGHAHEHAFVWSDGTMTALGTLGGDQSGAAAIDGAGRVVGMSTTASGVTHAFLWEQGVMTDLGALGGRQSRATAIDEDGVVVGTSRTGRGVDHAVAWLPTARARDEFRGRR